MSCEMHDAKVESPVRVVCLRCGAVGTREAKGPKVEYDWGVPPPPPETKA